MKRILFNYLLFITLISNAQGVFTWKTSNNQPSIIAWSPYGTPIGFANLWKFSGAAFGYHYMLMNVDGGNNFNLQIGQGAYVRMFLPPGVSKISIGTDDPSLLAGCVMHSFIGEITITGNVASSTNGSEVWTWGCNAFSKSFTRLPSNIASEGILIIGYYNIDNNYGTGFNINQLSYTYFVSDSVLFNNWINNTLPVKLLEFNIRINEQNVELFWTTASETNNNFFEIEKSNNGLVWQTIDLVNGSGNTNQITIYNYSDYIFSAGTYYYRLKQVDFDGNYKYLSTKQIEILSQNPISIFPNPSSESININNLSKSTGNDIKIYNSLNELCFYKTISNSFEEIDITNWPCGIYVVKIGTFTQKIIKSQ
jgi:hypothetical protein